MSARAFGKIQPQSLVAALLDCLINLLNLTPFLLFGNLEKCQRCSRKVIAVMQTIIGP